MDSKQTPPDDPLNLLLDRFYAAAESVADSHAASILRHIQSSLRRWLASSQATPADLEDACQQVSIKLLECLRASRGSGAKRIANFYGLAKTIAIHSAIDANRRNNPAHRLRLRLRYLTTVPKFQEVFARWNLFSEWLFGLSAWRGRPFVLTPQYEAFCSDDTRFFQQALKGRDPATGQVPLPELLYRWFQWIQTPLEESRLVEHLFVLTGEVKQETVYLEEMAILMQREADDLLPAPPPEEAERDWEACWQVICDLPPNARAALLLRQDPEMLVVLCGLPDPRPLLAQTLGVTPEQAALLYQRLPLSNEEIAQHLGATVNNVYVMTSRSLERIKKRVKIPRK